MLILRRLKLRVHCGGIEKDKGEEFSGRKWCDSPSLGLCG